MYSHTSSSNYPCNLPCHYHPYYRMDSPPEVGDCSKFSKCAKESFQKSIDTSVKKLTSEGGIHE